MYWIIANIIKHITYFLRVLQILLLFYTIIFFLYWVFEITGFSLGYLMSPIFDLPQEITNWIFTTFKWSIDSKFSIFLPKMFISFVFTFIVLIISNVLFIIAGSIERFFVEKSYEKGEREHNILK